MSKKIQILLWWDKPTFKKWKFPNGWERPMFIGYVFGLFEIRVWQKEPYDKN